MTTQQTLRDASTLLAAWEAFASAEPLGPEPTEPDAHGKPAPTPAALRWAWQASARLAQLKTLADTHTLGSQDLGGAWALAQQLALRDIALGTAGAGGLGLAGAVGLAAEIPLHWVWQLAALRRQAFALGVELGMDDALLLLALSSGTQPRSLWQAWLDGAAAAQNPAQTLTQQLRARQQQRLRTQRVALSSLQWAAKSWGAKQWGRVIPLAGAVWAGALHFRGAKALLNRAQQILLARRLQMEGLSPSPPQTSPRASAPAHRHRPAVGRADSAT